MITENVWEARRKRAWPSDRWGMLTCRATWDDAPDVRTFLLTPTEGSRIAHNPGQYMTFRIETAGGIIERCYTIASSAARNGGIEITVKHQPDGAASGTLHETLKVGAEIEAFGPSGQFTPIPFEGKKFALIAAGSGVTPMLSILRTAADRGIALDCVFVHVTRDATTAIAADEIPVLHRKLPLLVSHILPSQGAHATRLDPEVLSLLIPDLADRNIMCCGPDAFMAMVYDAAMDAGVPPANYLQESFTFADVADIEDAATDAPLRRITFAKTGVTFDCPEGMNILRAAKDAGVPMPSSCSKGECGTCKTFKHSGEVNMTNAGGIRQREMDRGFILPCTSRPLTDIILDR
ncbi:iron-sulfur cluster-binding domain-containing protein [Rhodobacteraceae bacterium S2214]|nr:iron-sulfur cluster-binding domain-containing protein [Rhodobacteraceae bacterium S2214]